MSSDSATETYNASLTLPGRPTGGARVRLTHRTLQRRLLQGLGAWLGLWALAPLVMFIPPHLPWLLAALILGLYFGIKYLRGEYVVRSFEGACPNCGEPLELKPGSHIRLPYGMDCFGCHRTSKLALEEEEHGG